MPDVFCKEGFFHEKSSIACSFSAFRVLFNTYIYGPMLKKKKMDFFLPSIKYLNRISFSEYVLFFLMEILGSRSSNVWTLFWIHLVFRADLSYYRRWNGKNITLSAPIKSFVLFLFSLAKNWMTALPSCSGLEKVWSLFFCFKIIFLEINFDFVFTLLVKKALNLEFKAVKLKYLRKGKHRVSFQNLLTMNKKYLKK